MDTSLVIPSTLQMLGPFAFDDNNIFVAAISEDRKKWVAWLPMKLFALDDKKSNIISIEPTHDQFVCYFVVL